MKLRADCSWWNDVAVVASARVLYWPPSAQAALNAVIASDPKLISLDSPASVVSGRLPDDSGTVRRSVRSVVFQSGVGS
jgi:hypothetical protein